MADARVEPDRGLVQEQHLRPRDERAGDLEAAALAAAVAGDRAVEQVRQAERGRQLLDPLAATALATLHSRAWMSRLRRPVRPRSTTASWNTTLLARRAAIGSSATSKPATRAVPPVGAMVVVSMPMVVDLPAPFGPSRPNTSPAATLEGDAPDGLDAAGIGLE